MMIMIRETFCIKRCYFLLKACYSTKVRFCVWCNAMVWVSYSISIYLDNATKSTSQKTSGVCFCVWGDVSKGVKFKLENDNDDDET